MTSPNPLCFLADDLSGALEAGAVFHRQNHTVLVSLKSAPLPAMNTGTIHGFDVNSRAQTSDDAYKAVFDLAAKFRQDGHPLVLKKIDSTMRGWIGQEIQAVLDSNSVNAVALCPSNPAAKRTVVNGVLLVEGVPVNRTDFKRDHAFPIHFSRIDEITRSQTSVPLQHCPLQIVQSSPKTLMDWVAKTMDSGASILSFDAVTEQDLESIARTSLSFGSRILPCGSGAMAEAVGKALGSPRCRGSSVLEKRSVTGRRRTAFLIGSAHPSSQVQYEQLFRSRPITVCRFDPNDPASWRDTLRSSFRALEGEVIALLPETQSGNMQAAETAIRIQAFYRRFAAATPPDKLPLKWFITGGETARSIIDALALEDMDIVDELEQGVAVAVTQTSDKDQTQPAFTFITKPGGFGHPDTLINCYDYLTR